MKKMLDDILKKNQGMAALATVVLIGSAALVMSVGTSMLSLDELEMGFTSSEGSQAMAAADGCMEEILYRIRADQDFSADNQLISIGAGTCLASVSVSGAHKDVSIEGIYRDYHKYIKAVVQIAENELTILSWAETP